jgi:hypothetical protein
MRHRAVFATVLLLAALPVAAATVRYDNDSSYHFSSPKTFTWVEKTKPEFPLAHPRIVKAIETQLAAKGLQAAAGGGDLKVDYHAVLANRTQITEWGYRPGWGRSIDVQQYTEGTLVVDLIDAATDKLVWRGSATDVASDNPQANEKRINKAMEKLFKKYPPPGK